MTACTLLTPHARADFEGLVFEVVSFEGAPGWQEELVVLDVFVAFDDPTDEVNAIYGSIVDPLFLTTTDPEGFFNATLAGMEHPFGQGPPLETFLPLFPEFNWDSFATIGISSFVGGLPFFFSPEFLLLYQIEGTFVHIDNGAWFLKPGNPTGTAGNYRDLDVRILRLTFREPACTTGTMNIIIRIDLDGVELLGVEFAVCTTPVGANLDVDLETEFGRHATVSYDHVRAPGITSFTVIPTAPEPPAGYAPVAPALTYDLTTQATVAGWIDLCLDYVAHGIADESRLRLLQLTDTGWVDVTTSIDEASNTICGRTDRLSRFILAEAPPDDDDESSDDGSSDDEDSASAERMDDDDDDD
jgi:hypothetical protein